MVLTPSAGVVTCVETLTSLHSSSRSKFPRSGPSQYSGATGPLFMLNDGFSAISDGSVA